MFKICSSRPRFPISHEVSSLFVFLRIVLRSAIGTVLVWHLSWRSLVEHCMRHCNVTQASWPASLTPSSTNHLICFCCGPLLASQPAIPGSDLKCWEHIPLPSPPPPARPHIHAHPKLLSPPSPLSIQSMHASSRKALPLARQPTRGASSNISAMPSKGILPLFSNQKLWSTSALWIFSRAELSGLPSITLGER